MSNVDRENEPLSGPGSNQPVVGGPARAIVIILQKSIWLLSRYWLFAANFLAGAILTLGFLAPAFMSAGLTAQGQAVYRALAPHNHQLPQRSYFLFGQAGGIQTYSLEQVLSWGADPQHLQDFVGDSDIGFKTALNHRMVAIFVAIFLAGLGWAAAGRQPHINFIGLSILTLPLLLDAFSHIISESSGQGFRVRNDWAALLTGNELPLDFYQGTTLGSLNWLFRTLTGFIFGLGLVWFLYAYLSHRFARIQAQLEPRLKRIGAIK